MLYRAALGFLSPGIFIKDPPPRGSAFSLSQTLCFHSICVLTQSCHSQERAWWRLNEMAHGATIASLENIIEGPVVHQMISAVPGRAGSRTQSVGLSGDTSTKGIASDCSHSSHYYIPAITRTQKERDSAHTQKEKDRCEVSKRQNKIIPNCKTLL